MSITDQKQEEVQFTPLTDLCIDGDDCRNVKDFYEHFNIDMTEALKQSILAFEEALNAQAPKEKLIELQNDMRVQLCVSVCSSEHPLFKDQLFTEVRDNAKQVAFLSNFNKQLEELVTEDNSDSESKPTT